jgi:hypothetical protein
MLKRREKLDERYCFLNQCGKCPDNKKGESLPAVEIGIHSSLARLFGRQMTYRVMWIA